MCPPEYFTRNNRRLFLHGVGSSDPVFNPSSTRRGPSYGYLEEHKGPEELGVPEVVEEDVTEICPVYPRKIS